MTKQPITKKKILHVLHILYDILSALFIVLVSGALIINACRSDEKAKDVLTPNIQVEYKSFRNAIKGDGRSVCYSSDFLSTGYLTTICSASNLVNDFIDNNNNTKDIYIGEGYSGGSPTYPRVTDWNNINYNDMTTIGNEDSSNGWMYINRIHMTVTNTIDYSPLGLKLFYLRFDYQDDLEENLFHINTLLFVYGPRFNLDNNGFSFANYEVVIDYTSVIGNGFGVVYSNNRMLDNLLSAYDDDSYTRGYEVGKDVGYNNGYVDGSRGIESNAFTVIGQAFEAVSGIFSIEVLPGLPLWILVFTPLIIAVVIVVVKLIKG